MNSFIQNQILSKALMGNALRYKDLVPKGLDRDLFNYHLKFLLSKKLLVKENNLYSLTLEGRRTVTNLTIDGKEQQAFKVSVLILAVNSSENKILFQKRLRHPFFADTMIGISGKVNLGEDYITACSRKLLEETGLSGKFKLLGMSRILKVDKNNKLVEDNLYHIVLATALKGKMQKLNDFGLNFWEKIEKSETITADNKSKSAFDKFIVKLLNKPSIKFFYNNFTLQVEGL